MSRGWLAGICKGLANYWLVSLASFPREFLICEIRIVHVEASVVSRVIVCKASWHGGSELTQHCFLCILLAKASQKASSVSSRETLSLLVRELQNPIERAWIQKEKLLQAPVQF